VPPAVSQRTRIGVPCRWASGTWARAASSTVMWSAALFAPALPGRSRAVRNSPVLSQNASIGWNPNVPLNVALAWSFSECAITMVASRSITSTPRPPRVIARPAARARGNARPRTSVCWAQATSRAAARAAATAAPSRRFRTRHTVESEATAPNSSR
jgi:hypothetical protein